MKFIYYGVNDLSFHFIEQWQQANNIAVTCVSQGLSAGNINLAQGHDGICLYLSDDMRENESIYRQLHEYGIRQLSLTATGVDGLNREWAKRYGLSVTNVPSYSPTSVGHFALMSILMLLRGVPAAEKNPTNTRVMLGRELSDVTVGIVGTGRIGSVVAQSICGLGGKVIAYSETANPQLGKEVRYVSFEELLAESDVISLHVPLTRATRHLFSQDSFVKMKPGSMLVNTARGEIVDTQALLRFLESGRIAGFAADTIEDEGRYAATGWTRNPVCQQLVEYPNVVVTPHIAYYTGRAIREIAQTALDNAKDILMTGKSANQIQ